MSRATHLLFKAQLRLKGESKFTGRIRLFLGDLNGKTLIYDATPLFSVDQWVTVMIPMSAFQTLDLNALSLVGFMIRAYQAPLDGQVEIDDIVFYGPRDLGFESHRDNLIGFPEKKLDETRKTQLAAEKNNEAFLKSVAGDTWKYFENARDKKTGLIIDHIRTGEAPLAANYTSPTNIAMDLLAIVSAMDLGLIPRSRAVAMTEKILETLRRLENWRGFFYNFYDTNQLTVTRRFASSVDNGWLAVAFVVVREAFRPELYDAASAFLDRFNFEEFFDSEHNQISIGYDAEKKELASYHYSLLATEARAMILYAIGKGDIPREHWWNVFRTHPASWGFQTQQPKGKQVNREKVSYFQGYYVYHDRKFVPSWGGSLFEFLMPALVLKEKELAPHGLGLNDRIAAELHRDYALNEKRYPVWGISPAAISNGRQWRYAELGVPVLGAKGYPDRGIITPHVSFLALDCLSKDALANIRKLLGFNIYGEYGFYDSVEMKSGNVNPQYLALDQGMIMASIDNCLRKNALKERFHQDPIGKKAENLLMKESFFNS